MVRATARDEHESCRMLSRLPTVPQSGPALSRVSDGFFTGTFGTIRYISDMPLLPKVLAAA